MSGGGLRSRDFLLLLAAQTFFGLSFSTFILLPKFLAVELAASPAAIGLVTGAFGVASTLLMPWVGVAVDRAGRKRFALAGAVFMAFTAAAFALVDRVGPFAVGLRFLHGVANALEYVAAGALVIDLVPPARLAQALGLFGLTMLAMNAVAPAAAEAIAARWGYEPVFLAAGATSVIALFLLARVRERPGRVAASAPVRLLPVLLRPRSLWFMSIALLVGVAFGAMFTFVPPFAVARGAAVIAPFFTFYALAAMLVRGLLGGLVDRLGRARVAVVSLVLYAAVVFATRWLGTGLLPWLGAGFGLAHGALYPALNALAIEGAGEHERGTVFALYLGAWNAGWSLGSFGFGAVAERFSYPAVFTLASAVALLALVVLVGGAGRRRAVTTGGR